MNRRIRPKAGVPRAASMKARRIAEITSLIQTTEKSLKGNLSNFHDFQAKKILELRVNDRAALLSALKNQNPELYTQVLQTIGNQ